jgi:hypothetical protein
LALAGVAVVAAFAVRFDELRARWDPVTIVLPVRDAQAEAPMQLAYDPSVGTYAFSPVANKGRVAMSVTVPRAGRYYLWGHVWEAAHGGSRGDADSFFVYVDGGQERLWHIGCQNERDGLVDGGGAWRWQRVREMPNSDSDCVLEDFAFDLDAGTHRIVIRNREQATSPESAPRLAAMVVTTDPDHAPQ